MTDTEPRGPLWHRAAELVGVDFPSRTIELIVIPYEAEALVGYEGRMVRETIARGAFEGIQRRANRIRANRDHQNSRTFGRCIALHPNRDEGLVAEVRAARTPLGDETLALAEDGCLDASAGFLPMPGGMQWQTRSAYRITKAWLGHIALVPDPAHEGARVLAVRSAPEAEQLVSATPNLDQVRAWRLEQLIASDQALTD